MGRQKYYFYRVSKNHWKTIFENMRLQLWEYLQQQDMYIELKKIGKEPSDQQRGYYWAVVLPAIKKGLYELGNDHYKDLNDIHIFMKDELGHYDIQEIKVKEHIISAKKYKSVGKEGDREETSKYLDACIRWAAENLGIVIPEADRFGYKDKV